jgi:dolichol-phosphate mannosyltransferase
MVLGSSDVFSGLFVLQRSLWERGGRRLTASGSSLVLELLLRRPSRCVDVPVAVGPQFRRQRFQFQDLRPLKHVLDGRYGSFSRLIQFCCVGASGMVVDLTFYAFFQWILSLTWLATVKSARFGVSWHLAIAAALSIAIALLWNFMLNRRLTFNDARGGSWIRQFLTYVLSNALAIALSFSVRLYLPARVAFFARHRLAAAVVGIVAATGISFTMSRWIVFTRRPESKRAAHIDSQPQVSPPSVLV